MPHPISIASIAAAGFLGGLFTMQAGRGVIIGMLIHATWTWFFMRGQAFSSDYWFDLLIYWFFALLEMAFGGAMLPMLYRFNPILDGITLAKLYREKGKLSYGKIGKMLAKLILVLAIFFGAHLAFEIDSPSLPDPWGGLIMSAGIILGWVVFALLFRSELNLFRRAPEGATGSQRFWMAEITNYVLIGGVAHFAYMTAYWIWEFVHGPVGWVTSGWYFFSALIIGGAIIVIFWIVGFFFSRSRRSLEIEYQQLTEIPPANGNGGSQPTAGTTPLPPPPGTTGSAISPAAWNSAMNFNSRYVPRT